MAVSIFLLLLLLSALSTFTAESAAFSFTCETGGLVSSEEFIDNNRTGISIKNAAGTANLKTGDRYIYFSVWKDS